MMCMKSLTKSQINKFLKLNYNFKYNDDNGAVTIKDFNGYRKLAKKDINAIISALKCDEEQANKLIYDNAEHYSPALNKEQAENEKRLKKEQAENEKRLKKEQAENEKRIKKEQAENEKRQVKELENNYCNEYVQNFDFDANLYNNIELLKMSIHLDLTDKHISKPLVNETITKIISKIKLLKSAKQYELYSSLGYKYDDDGKIDQNAPINYDIFYENHFADKIKWDDTSIEDRKKLNYVFYDTWLDACRIWHNNKFDVMDMRSIRNIVRSYAPVSNKDIINDGFIDWVKTNRETNLLKDYFISLQGKWDGIDRLGLFDENKDNIILEIWDAEQSSLYKHEINYILIHGYRQTLHPCKYNYQHMCVIHGVSDNGKTKVLRDLFTFNLPGFDDEQKYFSEDLEIDSNNWTIAPIMNRNLAIIFGERQGISKADNNSIKKWVDKLNGTIQYQKKGENEIREVNSHCIAFISTNDNKLLNDFTLGGYDKRFHIIHINGTNERFVNQYLNTINENKEQIWAQIAEWYIRYNDKYDLLDITQEDKNALNNIQSNYRTINEEDIMPILNDIFNCKTYSSSIIEVETGFNENGNIILNIGYLSALKAYCKRKYSWQGRHWEYISQNNYAILEKIGLKFSRKTIKNSRIQCLERINYDDLSHISAKNVIENDEINEQEMPF